MRYTRFVGFRVGFAAALLGFGLVGGASVRADVLNSYGGNDWNDPGIWHLWQESGGVGPGAGRIPQAGDILRGGFWTPPVYSNGGTLSGIALDNFSLGVSANSMTFTGDMTNGGLGYYGAGDGQTITFIGNAYGNASFGGDNISGQLSPTINNTVFNYGSLHLTGGGSLSSFENHGFMEVTSGGFEFRGLTTNFSGQTINFSGAGTVFSAGTVLNDGVVNVGDGVIINGGSFTGSGTYTFGDVTFTPNLYGQPSLSGATIALSGTMAVNVFDFSIANTTITGMTGSDSLDMNAGLVLSGTTDLNVSRLHFNGRAGFTLASSDYQLVVHSGQTIDGGFTGINQSGGVVNTSLVNNGTILYRGSDGAGGGSTIGGITNRGYIEISDTGVDHNVSLVSNEATGTIEVTGNAKYTGYSLHNEGVVNVRNGATLAFSNLTGSGSYNNNLIGSGFSNNLAESGSYNFDNGALQIGFGGRTAVSGVTLNIVNGLTLKDTTAFTDATVRGDLLTANAVIEVVGSNNVFDVDRIVFSNGAFQLTNVNGASEVVISPQTTVNGNFHGANGGVGSRFVNNGTIEGNRVAFNVGEFVNNSGGSVTITNGRLDIDRLTTNNGIINVTDSGFAANGTFTNTGAFNLKNVTAQANALTGPGAFHFDNVIQGPSALNFSGTTVDIANGFTSANPQFFDGVTLNGDLWNMNSTAIFQRGNHFLNVAQVKSNAPLGIIALRGSGTELTIGENATISDRIVLVGDSGTLMTNNGTVDVTGLTGSLGTNGKLVNNNVFRYSADAFPGTRYSFVDVTNNGIFEATRVSNQFSTNGILNNGTVNINGGAIAGYLYGSGAYNITNAVDVNSGGGLFLIGATLNSNGFNTYALSIYNGATVKGPNLILNGALNAYGYGNRLEATQIRSSPGQQAAINLMGNSDLTLGRDATVSGRFSISANGSQGFFTNEGSLLADISGDNYIGTFTNAPTGKIRVADGARIRLDTALPVNKGSIEVDEGGRFWARSGLQQVGADARLVVNGQLETTTLFLDGGTLSGEGTVIGNVLNRGGQVVPGNSPGTLTVQGNYSQGANGSLLIELGKDRFDTLVVTGTATLNGTLFIRAVAGNRPRLDQTFTVLVSSSMFGVFDRIESVTPGYEYSYTYAGNRLTILVTQAGSAPEPGTLAFTLFGLLTLGFVLRRRR